MDIIFTTVIILLLISLAVALRRLFIFNLEISKNKYEIGVSLDIGKRQLQADAYSFQQMRDSLMAVLVDGEGEMAFYLPRPVLSIPADTMSHGEGYDTVCCQASARKKQKSMKYLRASRMADYVDAMRAGAPFLVVRRGFFPGVFLGGVLPCKKSCFATLERGFCKVLGIR